MSDPLRAQALYRRWRPQTFDEVIGQEHISRTLRNAVAAQRLAHAYLFTGPRGTGKTSVARILAKAINCTGEGEKPCNECSICRSMTEGRSLDLIEIDAASNTGVDDVRDLRDRIGFAPNEARYKVYVVDEAHMLSTAAFNALLKTLEEPPAHAVFVLATTDPHKIPDTIVSRCQRHDFRRTPLEALRAKLERICVAERIPAEPAALDLIARAATGSVRDAESLLDQLAAAGADITVDYVRELLGTPTDGVVAGLAESLAAADAAAGLRLLAEAFDRGADARHLQAALLDHLRLVLLLQTGVEAGSLPLTDEQRARLSDVAGRIAPSRLVRAIHLFNDARPGTDLATPALPLELALVESLLAPEALAAEPFENDDLGRRPDRAEPSPAPARAAAGAPPPASPPGGGRTPAKGGSSRPTGGGADRYRRPVRAEGSGPSAGLPAQGPGAPQRSAGAGAEPRRHVSAPPPEMPPRLPEDAEPEALAAWLREAWPALCAAVSERDRNTAALLKDCVPAGVEGNSIVLGFFYDFHCRRVSEPQRASLVADVFEQALGRRYSLSCVVAPAGGADAEDRPRTVADQARQDPVVRHAVDELGARVSGVSTEPDQP